MIKLFISWCTRHCADVSIWKTLFTITISRAKRGKPSLLLFFQFLSEFRWRFSNNIFTRSRSGNFEDAIANTIGTLCGFGISKLCVKAKFIRAVMKWPVQWHSVFYTDINTLLLLFRIFLFNYLMIKIQKLAFRRFETQKKVLRQKVSLSCKKSLDFLFRPYETKSVVFSTNRNIVIY